MSTPATFLRRYSRLFSGGPPPYGIDVPRAWLPFLASMLDGFLNEMEIHPDVTIQLTGLKEKFGLLRVSYQLQFEEHVDKATRSAVGSKAAVLTQQAETLSAEICSVCGQPGQRVRERIWTAIRCPGHASRKTAEPRLFEPAMDVPAE